MNTASISSVLIAASLIATSCAGSELDLTTGSESSSSVVVSTTDPVLDGVTIIRNAVVHTMDAERSVADAFAYDANGAIIAVGSEAEMMAAAPTDATVIDADGRMIIPGFHDAHVHVPEAGVNLEMCFFEPDLSLADYESLAVDCAGEQAGSDWVRAAGAALFDLRNTNESPLAVLDRAIPDRPAIVLDNLGHAIWTNSLGLEAAGIGPDADDPQGGVFHRDDEGELTGLLLEDAQHLVRSAASPDDATIDRGLRAALEELAAQGVTTISDAGGYWQAGHPEAWRRADNAGDLTVRALNTLYVYPGLPIDDQLAEFERRFSNDADSLLQFDTAKVYVDGILDLGTAWLVDPYDVAIDDNYPSGFTYFRGDQLRTYVNELHQIGYRINFHAIGDAAVRDALDAVAAIDDDPLAVAGRRHRSTHTYLVASDDVSRFAELGVIADFQSSADAVATDYHEFLSDFIGDRAFDLIPIATLIDSGAAVSLSSDWDAGPLPPLGTIERALTRDTNAVPDLQTALELATINAAYALGHDDRTGSIEVGKLADFVVFDRNLFTVPVDVLDEVSVVLTVLGGDVVYDAGVFTE